MKIFLLLIAIIISIICKGNKSKKEKKIEKNKVRNVEDKFKIAQDPENINILSIAYELTYEERSVLKVVLKSIDDLDHDFTFSALLKTEGGKREYKLRCVNTSVTVIECYSLKNIKLNPLDKHYFYYKGDEKLTLDEKEVMEDWKRVTLIFKPEMYEEQIMWKDHRKILGLNNRQIVGGGYLYLVPKSKKLLHRTKDGFNNNIELKNFISHAGLYGQRPESTLCAYEEAIKRGFHIVDAELQFTKDKIPVIMSVDDLEKVSDGKGKISDKVFDELEKLDFGKKFDIKFAGEKILTFEKLLKLCKENDVIIELDLSHLDYKKYFEKTDEYAKIIIDTIKKNNMLNSIYFNDGPNPNIILKLKEIKNEISVAISNVNSLDQIKKAKAKYAGSKRIIYSFSGLSKGNGIDEEILKYALSTGDKIKVSTVDHLDMANKLFSSGVNFIATNQLHPFLIKNEYEEPLLLKCTQFDVLADCRFGPEVKLVDNEVYNIYYSNNIYNLYEGIQDQPIGEFKYLDTIKLDDLYYNVLTFDFENSYIKLNVSVKLDKGKEIRGKVGPNYENVPDCYLYDFVCVGNNKYHTHCRIIKNDTNVVPFDGNYTVYSLVNYSIYIPQNVTKENSLFGIDLKKDKVIIYFPTVCFLVIITFLILFSFKNRKTNKLKQVTIVENYMTEATQLNK